MLCLLLPDILTTYLPV